jgi:hypothetical protein
MIAFAAGWGSGRNIRLNQLQVPALWRASNYLFIDSGRPKIYLIKIIIMVYVLEVTVPAGLLSTREEKSARTLGRRRFGGGHTKSQQQQTTNNKQQTTTTTKLRAVSAGPTPPFNNRTMPTNDKNVNEDSSPNEEEVPASAEQEKR